MKKVIMIVTILALSFIVGCGTWHGLGKDVGKVGDAMAGEEEKHNDGPSQSGQDHRSGQESR